MNPAGSGDKTLAERYPDVGRLLLFVAFEEADAEAEPNYQQIIFTPDAVADFRLDCSREECAGGGFDYAPFIDELIRRKEERAHGEIVCAGQLDDTGQCCELHSEYRIIVQYRP